MYIYAMEEAQLDVSVWILSVHATLKQQRGSGISDIVWPVVCERDTIMAMLLHFGQSGAAIMTKFHCSSDKHFCNTKMKIF